MELQDVFGSFDPAHLVRGSVRLIVAAALAGAIGAQRAVVGKAAGVRTHMMVSLGAALFVLVPIDAGIQGSDLTRVIQGIATGIGFVGAGTILKRTERDEIQGLTTAATIWFVGAVGIAVGVGQIWIAVVGVTTALVILSIIGSIEQSFERRKGMRIVSRRDEGPQRARRTVSHKEHEEH